jgi:hypothetical protein
MSVSQDNHPAEQSKPNPFEAYAAFLGSLAWPGEAALPDGRPIITITIFPDKSGSRLTRKTMSLPDLREFIEETTAESKEELPLLKLATFGKQRSSKNSLRTNDNVLKISGVEGDYDRGAVAFEEAVAIMEEAHLCALLYSSPSYTDAKPKWRILLPTSEDLPPPEREKLVARVNGLLDGALDPASFTLSQAFYFGRVAGSPPPRTAIVEGDCVDLRADLDQGAGRQRSNANLFIAHGDASRMAYKPPVDVAERLAAMLHGGEGDTGIHVTQLSVTAALLNRGVEEDEIVEVVLAATRNAGEESWDWALEERTIRGMCESWCRKHPPEQKRATPQQVFHLDEAAAGRSE